LIVHFFSCTKRGVLLWVLYAENRTIVGGRGGKGRGRGEEGERKGGREEGGEERERESLLWVLYAENRTIARNLCCCWFSLYPG